MKTLDIQYRQVQSINSDLGMPDIAGKEEDAFYSGTHKVKEPHCQPVQQIIATKEN